jgi:probable DNA metabolism protein
MAFWCYDGTFTGFLTLCATLFTQKEEPEGIVTEEIHQQNLFQLTIFIESDEFRAEKMLAAIASRISPECCHTLWVTFLSEAAGVEFLLWRYLSFGRTVGATCDQFLAHPAVAPVHKLARAVHHEAHKLLGIIRFQETAGGQWYAIIEPAYQVLELVAPHFAARCADMDWLIHDKRRNLAVAWNKKEWRIIPFDADGIPQLSAHEKVWSVLWQGYFTEIAIPERSNQRLQRQHLPRRFRKYLTEMK